MFLVSYFAVLSKKTYKGTTKNAYMQAKRGLFFIMIDFIYLILIPLLACV